MVLTLAPVQAVECDTGELRIDPQDGGAYTLSAFIDTWNLQKQRQLSDFETGVVHGGPTWISFAGASLLISLLGSELRRQEVPNISKHDQNMMNEFMNDGGSGWDHVRMSTVAPSTTHLANG